VTAQSTLSPADQASLSESAPPAGPPAEVRPAAEVQPAAEVRPAAEAEAAAGHVWIRAAAGWEVAFWTFLAVGTITVAVDHRGEPRTVVALGLIAVIGAAHGILRPRVTERRRSDLLYLVIVVVALGPALAADPNLWVLLCIAFSNMWSYLDSVRKSMLLVVALAVSAAIGLMTADGWKAASAWVVGPVMMTSLVAAVLFGVWITRIIAQSRERAELITQLEATRAELGEAYHSQGVMAERERLAREIHDTLAQGYTSIIMLVQAAQSIRGTDPADPRLPGRLEMIEEVARENLGEARALVAAFAPVPLDGATLAEAVERLTARFGVETGVAIDAYVSPDLGELSRDREVVLLRAVQEALANVRRHARARLVTVSLGREGDCVQVQITDDGIGFDASGHGFGLRGMRDRADEAGGRLDLTTAPGRGTTVVVRVPAS
jgi:signal transduction histidine kinase